MGRFAAGVVGTLAVAATFSLVYGFGDGSLSAVRLLGKGKFNVQKSGKSPVEADFRNASMAIYTDFMVLDVGDAQFRAGDFAWDVPDGFRLVLDNARPKEKKAKLGATSPEAEDSLDLLGGYLFEVGERAGYFDDGEANTTSARFGGTVKADRSFSTATGALEFTWKGLVDGGDLDGRKFTVNLKLKLDGTIFGPTPPPRPECSLLSRFALPVVEPAAVDGVLFGGAPRFAVGSGGPWLHLYGIDSGRDVLLENVTLEHPTDLLRYSPNGLHAGVFFPDTREVQIMNQSAGQLSPWGQPVLLGSFPATNAEWSADSRFLFVSSGQENVSSGVLRAFELNPLPSATPLLSRGVRTASFIPDFTVFQDGTIVAIHPRIDVATTFGFDNQTGQFMVRDTTPFTFMPTHIAGDGASQVWIGETSATPGQPSSFRGFDVSGATGGLSQFGVAQVPGRLVGLDHSGNDVVTLSLAQDSTRQLALWDSSVLTRIVIRPFAASTGGAFDLATLDNVTAVADESENVLRIAEKRAFRE